MYLRTPLRTGRAGPRPAGAGRRRWSVPSATVVFGVYPKPLAEAAKAAVPLKDDRPQPMIVEAGRR